MWRTMKYALFWHLIKKTRKKTHSMVHDWQLSRQTLKTLYHFKNQKLARLQLLESYIQAVTPKWKKHERAGQSKVPLYVLSGL